MIIYHNPRCKKSREALSILMEKGVSVKVVDYLKYPLTKEEVKIILKKLNICAKELIRREEKIFKELYKGGAFTNEEYIDILYNNPILMQRPIIVKDNSAVIGRPPIKVLDLLNK